MLDPRSAKILADASREILEQAKRAADRAKLAQGDDARLWEDQARQLAQLSSAIAKTVTDSRNQR